MPLLLIAGGHSRAFVSAGLATALFAALSTEALAFAVHAEAALLVAGATVTAWRRPGPHDLKVALAAAGTLLVSPYVMIYDLLLLAIPLAVMANRALAGGRPTYAGLLVLAAAAPLLIGPVSAIRIQVVAPILWALYDAIWTALRQETDPPPAPTAPSAAS